MITSKELRKKWIDFYVSKGHTDIGAVSLIGDGTTGVMFNVAGMQPLMPYLLGKKHPAGTSKSFSALPYHATAALIAPYSAVPGFAQRRAATSFCTITVILSMGAPDSSSAIITGVVI